MIHPYWLFLLSQIEEKASKDGSSNGLSDKALAGTARSCLTLSEEQNELALDRRTIIFNAKDCIKSLVFAFGQRGTDRVFSSKEAVFLIFNVLD